MDFPDPRYREVCSAETLRSSKRGFFSHLSSAVAESVGEGWINGAFADEQLEEDKIRICCRETRVWSYIRDAMKHIKPVYREKSAAASSECRRQGEKMFEDKDFKRSAMLFTQSIIRAPDQNVDCSVDEGLSLALAYNCRANALLQLQLYEQCLVDLHMSIRKGIPKDTRSDIYRKMGECYDKLNNAKGARVSLKVALKMVEDQISTAEVIRNRPSDETLRSKSLSHLRREREEIQRMLEKLSSESSGEKVARIAQLPRESQEKGAAPVEVRKPGNPKYPNASRSIAIAESAKGGRFAVAAEDMTAGETVVVEAPLGSCLVPDKFSSHCHHCYSRLSYAVPCDTCSGVAFCSSECRDAALSTYHRYECQFMGLFIGSGMSVLTLLSLRLVTQESASFFVELWRKVTASKSGEVEDADTALTEKESDYLKLHRLVSHSHMRTNEDYFERTLMAIFLVKCLKKAGYFSTEIGDGEELTDEELLGASVILRHLQVLQFNAHEVYETRVEARGQTRGAKSVYVAVAVYPTVALFNHECSPAVTRYFHGKNIVIKTVRPIRKGEIVSENYGPIFTKRSLPERVRELTSRYWFRCECDACSQDWPKMEDLSEDRFRLRCPAPGCMGFLDRSPGASRGSRNREAYCRRCYTRTDVTGTERRVSRARRSFRQGLELMDSGRCDEAVPLLIAYLNEIFRVGAPPSREISLCQEALRTCYAQTGNVSVAYE